MAIQLGDTFTQRIDSARIYFTHYALFEEPDTGIPAALYIDAATGAPTSELTLTPPIVERVFTRVSPHAPNLTAPTDTSQLLPYFVQPPGFPPLAAPAPIVSLIASITGAPMAQVQAGTTVLLVAIGQFLAEGTTTGRLDGARFEVDKTMRFQVRIRTGFIYQVPSGTGQSVGVLTGYLDMGVLHQLIQLPPPPDPTQIVLYDWRAPMTLSTDNRYVREIATQPKPVADLFPPGLAQIAFTGEHVGNDGSYRVVGSAKPSDVIFTAPPELEQFLFGTSSLTDVEFAIQESGRLVP
jgi:hypothetical protein